MRTSVSRWTKRLGMTAALVGLLAALPAIALASPMSVGSPGPFQRPIMGATPTPEPGGPTMEVIGTSVEGRPIEVYRFGSGPEARLVAADIHGGYEWNTNELANALIELLSEHPALVPPNITLYILPTINPDGLAASQGYQGRANPNGVDLNRNFPFDWKSSWRTSGCWNYLPITAGTHALSEPESQAVARFVLSRHIRAMISYHSAALGIFAGGYPPSANSMSLARRVASVAPYPFPPRQTGCEYTGEMVDWADANGIAAIDVELTNHYDPDIDINRRVLYAFMTWQP